MTIFLSKSAVRSIVSRAIQNREILSVRYKHIDDKEIVNHTIAPFDIGTTTLKNIQRFANNLYAYSFTHVDDKTRRLDAKVITFNIEHFIYMSSTGETFDETELAKLNQAKSRYDYRQCKFALLPNRNWFEN